MQRIREWMQANPDQAKDVRRQNKSYVFFRITDLATEDEAIGAEGVPLVPGSLDRGRSFAACLRHAVLHRGRFADRQRKGGDEIPPAGCRAGYRLGHRRAGARRYLFRRRRRSRAHGRPHQELRPVHDADATGARSGRGGARCAAAAGAPEPHSASAGLDTMVDPTAEEVPLPEPKPVLEPAPCRAACADEIEEAAKTMSRRRQLSDEDRALWSRFRTLRSSRCGAGQQQADRAATAREVAPHRHLASRRGMTHPHNKNAAAFAIGTAAEASRRARPRAD